MAENKSYGYRKIAVMLTLMVALLAANCSYADQQHLIKIHKQSYRLELFEDGLAAPVRTYGVVSRRTKSPAKIIPTPSIT